MCNKRVDENKHRAATVKRLKEGQVFNNDLRAVRVIKKRLKNGVAVTDEQMEFVRLVENARK